MDSVGQSVPSLRVSAPSRSQIVRAASLFTGIGGADLGLVGGFSYLGKYYRRNPFEVVFANDIDKPACETYKANFKNNLLEGDIWEIRSKYIPDHDLTIGGFPCQPFSIVGLRKGISDARGTLVYEMARVLKDKKPSAFIAENVKGILSSNNGRDFERILDMFEAPGYDLKWAVLNSADYGVPQRRERVFIVGVRSDLGVDFAFPKATHGEEPTKGLKQWTPMRVILDPKVPKRYFFSERAVQGMLAANKAFNKGRVQDLGRPCATVTTHLAKISLNGTDPVILIPGRKPRFRRLTPQEAARVQSFPESFKFLGHELVRYRQIGNAIPPVLFWHLAKAVYRQVFS